MKRMKMLLDEMHQSVQAFNRNNLILKDNWQDKKSEHFSDACITIDQEYAHLGVVFDR